MKLFLKKRIYLYGIALLSQMSVELRADSSFELGDEIFRSHKFHGSDRPDCRKLSKQIKCLGKKIDACCNNSCDSAITFGSKEINQQGGYVISSPGHYCLKEDVIFNPTLSPFSPSDPFPQNQKAVQAAITITASDVFLDLGSHTLSQAGADTSSQIPFCIGILVPDPLPKVTDINAVGQQSVYIRGNNNSIIDGFSMYGIRIFAHTYDIRLSDLTIKNCGTLASKNLPRPTVYGFEYLPHTTGNPTPVTPGFGPSFGVGGLVIGESTAFGMGPVFFADTPTNFMNNVNRASGVTLENVSCLNNFFMGMMSPCITDMTITGCHFDNTWADDPGRLATPNGPPAYIALSAFGLNLVNGSPGININGNIDPNCVNLLVSNSTFNGSTIRGDYTTSVVATAVTLFIAGGVRDTRSQNCTWNDCQFNNATSTFVSLAGGARVVGFESGGVEDFTFNNCHFDGITNIGTVQAFHVSGSTGNAPTKSNRNVRLIKCTANNLHCAGDLAKPAPTLSSSFLTGFLIDYSKNCVLEDCVTYDLINTSPVSGASFSSGISPTSSANVSTAEMENIIIRNCLMGRVQAYNGGQAYGMDLFCPIITNTTTPPLYNSIRSVVFENCIATGNEAFAAPTAPQLILPPWSALTNYTIGTAVVYLGINYVALIASGPSNGGAKTPLGNPTYWAVITSPALANTYNPIVDYVVNGLVVYNDVNYKAIAANGPGTTVVTPGTNPAVWSLNTGIVQGAGVGYFSEQDDTNPSDAPCLFINCVAARNKGAIVQTQFGIPRYSSGFQMYGGGTVVFDSCKATDNIYGFVLSGSPVSSTAPAIQCVNYATRNCQADNNSATFTMAGLVLTVSVSVAGNSYVVGDNLTLNTGSGTAQVQVTAVSAGGHITTVALTVPGSGYMTGPVSVTGGIGSGAMINILSVLTGSIESATASGGNGYMIGDVLTVLTGSGTAQVMVTSVSGGAVTGVSIVNPGFGYITGTFGTTTGGLGIGATVTITAVIVGEGFTDTGTGTISAPTVSQSIWESNRAYNNGPGALHVGPNGNYNIFMNAAGLRPPLLSGQASTGVYNPTDPTTYFASLHNNSVIL